MNIDSYKFGEIIINGRRFTSDVIIFPEKVKEGWWRIEGHKIHPEDLEEALAEQPEVLILGTGYYGLVQVPPEIWDLAKKRGVELIVEPTEEACRIYNELSGERKVVAALHLTC